MSKLLLPSTCLMTIAIEDGIFSQLSKPQVTPALTPALIMAKAEFACP